jgi:glycosyltransferase involved in cell wall biosynthesis
MAGAERRYPWLRSAAGEPFDWATLFPDRDLEGLSSADCRAAILDALGRDRPDALGVVGYARPESSAMLAGRGDIAARRSSCRRARRSTTRASGGRRRSSVAGSLGVAAGLVGGPRHADYLATLGLPRDRIALGYNAVDNDHFARVARASLSSPVGRLGLPDRPYFIAVSRFVPEKNLPRLVDAYARYRAATTATPWDLVLCGDGPDAGTVEAAIVRSGHGDSIHRPGFLQSENLPRWLAFASGFVHPSLMEPWGLVANEAAACGIPLLVSDRAGCAETLVPDPAGTSGRRFDPTSTEAIASALRWLAERPEDDRRAMGVRAEEIVAEWGPGRFASGMLEAIAIAIASTPARPRRARPLQESTR